jgi:septum formation protein
LATLGHAGVQITLEINQLILASTSPFRQTLLASTGLAFTACNAEVNETAIQATSPAEQARLRAEAKALAVAQKHPFAVVIGADQVASFEDKPFDKAKSEAEARARLLTLRANTHFLHSAFSLAFAHQAGEAKILHSTVVNVGMSMRALDNTQIEHYLATGEWQGCVGCYRVEGRGMHLFSRVDRDQSAVIGLPLQELLQALREVGIDGLNAVQGPWKLNTTHAPQTRRVHT